MSTEVTTGTGIRYRIMACLKKGERISGHVHHFDHDTLVRYGCAEITAWKAVSTDQLDDKGFPTYELDVNGALVKGRFVARQKFGNGQTHWHCLVPKDSIHEIEALEEGTEIWCLHTAQYSEKVDTVRDIGWTVGDH